MLPVGVVRGGIRVEHYKVVVVYSNVYEYVSISMYMNTCIFVCMRTKVREWVSNVPPYLSHSFVTVTLYNLYI